MPAGMIQRAALKQKKTAIMRFGTLKGEPISFLINGILWDLAGNAAEWVKDSYHVVKPSSRSITSITNFITLKSLFGPEGNYASLNTKPYGGLGWALFERKGTYAVVRGGSVKRETGNITQGVFHTSIGKGESPSDVDPFVGFRCVYDPLSSLCPSGEIRDILSDLCRLPYIGYYANGEMERACTDIPNKQHFTTHGGTSPTGCDFTCKSSHDKEDDTRACTKSFCFRGEVRDSHTGLCRLPHIGYFADNEIPILSQIFDDFNDINTLTENSKPRESVEAPCTDITNKLRFTTHGGNSRRGCDFECQPGHDKDHIHKNCLKKLVNEPMLRWFQDNLTIDYNWDTCPTHSREAFKYALQQAVNVWNSIPEKVFFNLKLRVGESLDVTANKVYESYNSLYAIQLPSPNVAIVVCDDFGDGSESTIGRTFYGREIFNRKEPLHVIRYATHATIVINTNKKAGLMQWKRDLRPFLFQTVTHEIGHMIGLYGHDPDFNSLMYGKHNYKHPGPDKILSVRDKNRIIQRYPIPE